MANEADLFSICQQLALDCGIKTVWRGAWLPCEWEVGAVAYPAMGYVGAHDGESADTSSSPGGFKFKGQIRLDFWNFTGREGVQAMALNPGDWKAMDDLHDVLFDRLGESYDPDSIRGPLHGADISLFADRSAWEPLWWYRESPHIGAIMKINYEMMHTKPQ